MNTVIEIMILLQSGKKRSLSTSPGEQTPSSTPKKQFGSECITCGGPGDRTNMVRLVEWPRIKSIFKSMKKNRTAFYLDCKLALVQN